MDWSSNSGTDCGVGNLAWKGREIPTTVPLDPSTGGRHSSPSPCEICKGRTLQIPNLTIFFFSLFYFCFLGTSGISLSHHFYRGSIFKSNSLWTSLSPQCLPPQRLEFTRFYNCGCRVSIISLCIPAPHLYHHLFFILYSISSWFGHCGTGLQAGWKELLNISLNSDFLQRERSYYLGTPPTTAPTCTRVLPHMCTHTSRTWVLLMESRLLHAVEEGTLHRDF